MSKLVWNRMLTYVKMCVLYSCMDACESSFPKRINTAHTLECCTYEARYRVLSGLISLGGLTPKWQRPHHILAI